MTIITWTSWLGPSINISEEFSSGSNTDSSFSLQSHNIVIETGYFYFGARRKSLRLTKRKFNLSSMQKGKYKY